MANIKFTDADSLAKYNKSTGAGTDGDPFVPHVNVDTIAAGTNAIGKLAANDGVDIGDVDVTSVDGVAAEGSALGNGILLQGDDGTDRKNVAVDATSGNVQVDVGSALPAGTNAIGKLAANSGVDIGDVDILSIAPGDNNIGNVDIASAIPAGTNTIGRVHHHQYTTVAVGERAGSATAVQLPSVACSLVNIKAVASNAGNVYVGGSGVTKPDGTTDTTTGFELAASAETGWLPTDNLDTFYIICDNAGDDIVYLALS